MVTKLLVILGVGALCAGWVLVRAFIRRVDPEAREVETTCCGHRAAEQECCGRHRSPDGGDQDLDGPDRRDRG